MPQFTIINATGQWAGVVGANTAEEAVITASKFFMATEPLTAIISPDIQMPDEHNIENVSEA